MRCSGKRSMTDMRCRTS